MISPQKSKMLNFKRLLRSITPKLRIYNSLWLNTGKPFIEAEKIKKVHRANLKYPSKQKLWKIID